MVNMGTVRRRHPRDNDLVITEFGISKLDAGAEGSDMALIFIG